MAATIQLRRYELVPGEQEAFLHWWQERIVPLRKAHGFDVLFAYLVPETDEFVWAVSHGGDTREFERAEAEYTRSPGRAAAFTGIPQRVKGIKVHLVQPVGA
jgi:hypothetical protein